MNDNLARTTRFQPFICSTCKMSMTEETMHGWVYSGYDAINMKSKFAPCPDCTDHAVARRKNAQIDRLLGSSRIPLRMAEWSFTTLPHDVDSTAKTRAIFFANGKTEKHALYLYGREGQGKTGIAISIIQAVMRRGEDAVFIRSLDLMDRLREAIARSHAGLPFMMNNAGRIYSDAAEPTEDELLKLIKSVKWLVLDDLAVEKPTDYVIQELKAIVEARMDNDLYTIFTSNFSLRELEDYWRPDNVQEHGFYPGKRVIARIAEYAEGVPMKGRNLRLVREVQK